MITDQTSPLAVGRQAQVYPWQDGRVLKLFRGNWPEAARHEFMIARLAYEQGAATPQPLQIIEENGRPGIVYERVNGSSLLKNLAARPWQLSEFARKFATLHLTVHRCLAPDLASAHAGLEALIHERREISAATKTALLQRLAALPDGDTLLHGDFHPDNVMITPQGRLYVIDWPNAARGHPLADVARTTIIFRVGQPLEASLAERLLAAIFGRWFSNTYLRTYFQSSPHTPADLARWEPLLAVHRLSDEIPGEAEKLVKFIGQCLDH
jgi:aminoglycoside phosphotransferase (APT) family kinase protein